ncbi:endolytic transglycosylase MltG [Pelistega europaea]|uniref:Endolytic murein transglycosylase n=1 Tax=Pelistega europaea TaxID=106147 RepID=A0A7Y4P4Q5_9BURK|nr:endolytic transglycosylase MltG [Pelistega europaea]NOL48943.1 endolytic transglycosylase MltG [Pelistega europaea]
MSTLSFLKSKRFWSVFFVFIAIIGGAVGAAVYKLHHWQTTPVSLVSDRVDIDIPRGSSVKAVANLLEQQHIDVEPLIFTLYARYTGQATQIKAGAYEIKQGQTALDILNMMSNGDFSRRSVLFVEGWSYKQIRQAIAKHPDIKQTLGDMSDTELMSKLGVPEELNEHHSLEGLLFPDTYVFAPGDTDFDIIRRAYEEGHKRLLNYWDKRAEGLPLKSPYEALILASIVEKETGHGEDRAKIAGVFINRLRANMPLQTDPTVIYGMGDKYQGRIRKVDLQTDTPWNTYTRNGLPPTPIASPGLLALQATLHPDEHKFYYFVSRGDGTSEFAENLNQHNRNVQKFILKKGQ